MKITFDKKKHEWCLTADAYTLMKFRKMFDVVQKSQEWCKVSESDENTADIYWFAKRYEIEVEDEGYLESKYQAIKQEEKRVQEFLESPESHTYVSDLSVPLRDYQLQSVELLKRSKRMILGDDLGLGKTASAIGGFRLDGSLPALVVTLSHLPQQWKKEIERFTPELKVHIIKQMKHYDVNKDGPVDVLIITYHKLAAWKDYLAKRCKYVIFDETQELRSWKYSSSPKKYKAAKSISDAAQYVIGLSATPIYNFGGEFYSVMNAIRPNLFGSWKEFYETWCSGSWDYARLRDPKAFGSFIRQRGAFIRRTRKDVQRELPKLQRIPHTIEVDESTLDEVQDSCSELAKIILSDAPLEKGKRMQLAQEFSSQLRQATGVAKAGYVAEFTKMILSSEEKVVVYSWHRAVYEILLKKLKDFNPVMYTGSESAAEKERSKEKFIHGDSRVMLMSIRSGAGLDGLQDVCRTVILGELDWSPGVIEQAIGRVDRDGQKDPVTAYYLVADCGIDPIMSDILGVKRYQIENVKDPNLDNLEEMEIDEDRIRKLAEHYLKSRAG